MILVAIGGVCLIVIGLVFAVLAAVFGQNGPTDHYETFPAGIAIGVVLFAIGICGLIYAARAI